MNKDIVDLIKAQGNQACVMIPDIIDTPTIDLGEAGIIEGVENIELNTYQKQQLIDFLDKHKNNSIFLLEFKSQEAQLKLLTTCTSKIEGDAFSIYVYTSFPSGNADGSVNICVITVSKVEGATDVAFGVKQLK